MLDTDRYRRWVAMLSASDAVLVQLALLAVAAVFVWERLRSLPEPWRGRARLLYAVVALAFLLVQVVTTRGALIVMLTVLAGSALARAAWVYRHRRAASGSLAEQEN